MDFKGKLKDPDPIEGTIKTTVGGEERTFDWKARRVKE